MDYAGLSKRVLEEFDRFHGRLRRLVIEFFESEEPPDPAAVEGERRSREADPWGVMAFELRVVLKGVETSIARGMDRLRSQAQAREIENA